MSLIGRIEDELKQAMQARDTARRDALRLILSALRSAEKELRRPLVAAAGPERLGGFLPPFALPLQDLKLLVLLQLAPQLLLGGAEGGEGEPESSRPHRLARAHGVAQLLLDVGDDAHSNGLPPPSTCQCRWKMVCPAPGPTLTIT